jgi:hypothetical protein
MNRRVREINSSKLENNTPALAAKSRKPYSPPALEQYGDLDALTHGGMSNNPNDGGPGGPATKLPCWIAEVLYGADDPRTRLLRTWLVRVYSHTAVGAPVVALYRACGQRVARWASRSALLRRMLTPFFDAGVAAALRHYTLAARSI